MKENKHRTKTFLAILGLVFALTLMGCSQEDFKDEPPSCYGGQVDENGDCIEGETDTTAPLISGIADIIFEGEDVPDYLSNITATDDFDGDLTNAIVVDCSEVDLLVEGSYTVRLTVTDEAGNVTTECYLITVIIPIDYESLAALDIASIDIWNEFDEVEGFHLPIVGSNGSRLSWSSSNPLFIQPNGYVAYPPVNSGPVDVTLTCSVKNGEYVTEVDFIVTLEPTPEVTVTSSVLLPFINGTDEFVVEDDPEVEIYYVNEGNVPYIDIQTFLNLVDGVIHTDILNIELFGSNIDPETVINPGQGEEYSDAVNVDLLAPDQMRITYERNESEASFNVINGEYSAVIDFTENTMTVNTLGFLSAYKYQTQTDYWRTVNLLSISLDPGDEIVFRLGDYNFDLVVYNDGTTNNYLMPFHIANLLFLSQTEYGIYYNGESLLGHMPSDYYLGSEEDKEFVNSMNISNNNSQDVPDDVKLATYNFFAFAFDYFYGIKEIRNDYETYYELLAPRLKSYMKADDSTYYGKMNSLLLDMDDGHTAHVDYGYYEDDPLRTFVMSVNNFRPLGLSRYSIGYNIALKAIEKYNGSRTDPLPSFPEVRIIDEEKTAVLFTYDFNADTFEKVKNMIDNLPGTVENIVFDMSLNGGGDAYAVAELLGLMTDENLEFKIIHSTGNGVETYTFNTDTTAYDYNWYVMTSGYTYSAANLFAAMVKEFDLGTIIGQRSGGGACTTMLSSTPDGTNFSIAGQNMLSISVGNEENGYTLINLENGIKVDIKMIDVTDDNELISVIKSNQD